ncbi:MAG: hypothetical protein CL583_04605 [Alteromonadaceae bacterium]|nr:hypothetical protein [Alteromonadaceae bacterium]
MFPTVPLRSRAPIFAHALFRALALVLAFGLAAPGAAETVDLSGEAAYPPLYPPDSLGGEVPRDVVLLGADMVEIAVALGAAGRILARPFAVDLPGIEETPHVIRERAGLEGVIALRPGVVVASSVIFRTLMVGLDGVGIENETIDRTLPATEKVTRLAALLGLEARGAELVRAIEADYREATAPLIDGRPIRILHISKQGAGGSFSAGGADTAVHNLILRVGGLNAAAEIGRDRYRPVTPESILMMAPDVVILSKAEMEVFGGDPDRIWADYPGLGLTPAGREKRLIVMRDLHVRQDAASSGIATKALARALTEMFP